MKSPTLLLQSLLVDFKRLNDATGTDRDYVTICRRFENEGYGFLTVALPTLCKALFEGLASGQFTCPTGFKRTRGGAIPRLFSGMLCEVFDSATGQLKENCSISAVQDLRQILLFFKKIPTDEAKLEQLDRVTKESFLEVDKQVLETYPRDKLNFLLDVFKHMLNSLHSCELDELVFKHGPGSVYDGETPNQKWASVCHAITLGRVDIDLFGFAPFAYNIGGISALEYPDFALDDTLSGRIHHRRASRGRSRLVTVPKTETSLRTITVEPCWNQFIQQGLNHALRDSIKKCRVLRNSLDLTDQARNQTLALAGSRTGEWSTLDLKSASDLLGTNLVCHLFDKFPNFMEAVVKARTPDCEVDACLVSLRKFAGMGNALTFPIQSVVFAAIAIAADRYSRGGRLSLKNVIVSSRNVRVFGDDIIVRTDVVHHVITWLEDFGLRVNTDKSFTTGNFRESCGVDAFKGVDVTPLYLKVRPCDTSKSAKTVQSLVELSNHMWMKGLYETSELIRLDVEERLGRRLPLARPDSQVLGWISRQGAYEFTQYSRTLHRPEIKAYVITSRKRSDAIDGYPALLKCLSKSRELAGDGLDHLYPDSLDVDHLKRSTVRYDARVVLRRVAA